jgi:hypothetical protein
MAIYKCPICKEEFDERDMEISHDIPKYLGGGDLDGRHRLCKSNKYSKYIGCHEKYEFNILHDCCWKLLGIDVPFSEDKRKYLVYINKVIGKPYAKIIAEEIKNKTFKYDNN